jgi:hypothetical protein
LQIGWDAEVEQEVEGNEKVNEKEVRSRREAGAVEVEVEVGRVMEREKRTDVGM